MAESPVLGGFGRYARIASLTSGSCSIAQIAVIRSWMSGLRFLSVLRCTAETDSLHLPAKTVAYRTFPFLSRNHAFPVVRSHMNVTSEISRTSRFVIFAHFLGGLLGNVRFPRLF